MLRDVSFRAILLGFYYGTTNIEHRPVLKYSVPQIVDIMKQRRAQGHEESIDEISYLFYDFHNYDVKTKVHVRYAMLVLANLIATIVTNPIDVCLSKIMTQEYSKYTGLFHCLRTVYKEEGAYKFLSGIHPRFMFNLINGCLFLFVYDRFIESIKDIND